MTAFILKRLLSALLTIWFLATATFFAVHAVPGDPLGTERALPVAIEKNLHSYFGLDQPLHRQYLNYMGRLLQGDLGTSYTQVNRSVNNIIADHFPVSAMLGLLALLFALLGGLMLGSLAAIFSGRWADHAITLLVIALISVPSFVFAALLQSLILFLNQQSGESVLPIAGWGSWRHMLAPAFVLGLATLAYISRLLRANLLEVAQEDYMFTARSKGISAKRQFIYHQLRNALLPVLTVMGPTITAITTGGFVVEQVFAIPGLGRFFIEAVEQLDYTVIMGTTVFYGVFLILMVTLFDCCYGLLDPRIRLAGHRT